MVSQLPWSRMQYWRDRRLGSWCFNVPSQSKLFYSFPHFWTKNPVLLWIIKQLHHVIPLNFVHSCTAQADVGVFLQKHLYQGLQREEGALRWRRGWKKSSASNLSWCCLRTHRRTGTRRVGWRSTREKQIQTHSSTCVYVRYWLLRVS